MTITVRTGHPHTVHVSSTDSVGVGVDGATRANTLRAGPPSAVGVGASTDNPDPIHAGHADSSGIGAGKSSPTEIDADAPQVRYLGGGGIPGGGKAGDILAKRTNADGDVVWMTPASAAEADNTRPITSAAVYREIGNINVILSTI